MISKRRKLFQSHIHSNLTVSSFVETIFRCKVIIRRKLVYPQLLCAEHDPGACQNNVALTSDMLEKEKTGYSVIMQHVTFEEQELIEPGKSIINTRNNSARMELWQVAPPFIISWRIL